MDWENERMHLSFAKWLPTYIGDGFPFEQPCQIMEMIKLT